MRNRFGMAIAMCEMQMPVVMVTPAGNTREGVMAAKKIQAKSKSKTAKKGARKVSPATPRGMARRQVYTPLDNNG